MAIQPEPSFSADPCDAACVNSVLVVDEDWVRVQAIARRIGEAFGMECQLRNAASNAVALVALTRDKPDLVFISGAWALEDLSQLIEEVGPDDCAYIALFDGEDPERDAAFAEAGIAHGICVEEATPENLRQLAWCALGVRNRLKASMLQAQKYKDAHTDVYDQAVDFISVMKKLKHANAELEETLFETETVKQEFERLASEDPLTGLANRSRFEGSLSDALAQAARSGEDVGVIMIDLDKFKAINDTMGHAAGDTLLKQVAERMKHTVRATDTVARLGGDEFAVIAQHLHDHRDTASVVKKLLTSLNKTYHIEGKDVQAGASFGVAVTSPGDCDAEELVRCADAALYRAKQAGRGVYKFFDSALQESIEQEGRIYDLLSKGMNADSYEFHVEPIRELDTLQPVGAKVSISLATDGEEGGIEAISAAEKVGFSQAIFDWMFGAVSRHVMNDDPALPVLMPLTRSRLSASNLASMLQACQSMKGGGAGRLGFSISERDLVRIDEDVMAHISALRRAGMRISICDFGLGGAPIADLKRLPVDAVEIAPSLLRDAVNDLQDKAIFTGAVRLVRGLGFQTIAVGVDTEEKWREARAAGCDAAYGSYVTDL
ncbi:MAG: diguanylate cyclase [Pseudomonadota bacterium]